MACLHLPLCYIPSWINSLNRGFLFLKAIRGSKITVCLKLVNRNVFESGQIFKMSSVLFINEQDSLAVNSEMPPFFTDLNLDQVIDWVTVKKRNYQLKPYFFSPLKDVDAIEYRQEVFRDLEDETLRKGIQRFADRMILLRGYLSVAENSEYRYHQMGWHLEAALAYDDAISSLVKALSEAEPQSRGLKRCMSHFADIIHSAAFQQFADEARDLKSQLSALEYNIVIRKNWVRVRKITAKKDYSQEVKRFFAKFKEEAVNDYQSDLVIPTGINLVEAKILDLVTGLYPETFDQLSRFCQKHEQFMDETVSRFDREIQFYFAYLNFIDSIRQPGLMFCYPQMNDQEKNIYVRGSYDIALAEQHRREGMRMVCNDFHLAGNERIFVVSGPNQGGKTTFARMFGQLHYLACLGCPVPGWEASLFVFDQIFTHFEREEDIHQLRGKLKDDVLRIHQILTNATDHSIIILNEIFTSTAIKDAVILGEKVLKRIVDLDALGVCVTYIDELSTLNEKTVSMVSSVDDDNPVMRTFKIIRQAADGRAYAMHIARQHHLTYDLVKERIRS